MSDRWYYRLFGDEYGPVTRDVLHRSLDDGLLSDEDEVRCGDEEPWFTVRDFIARGLLPGQGDREHGGLQSINQSGMHGELESERQNQVVDQWYCESGRVDFGPHSFAELLVFAQRGKLGPEDRIRLGEEGPWRRAGSMGRLMAEMPYQPQEVLVDTSRSMRIDPAEEELESSIPFRDGPVATMAVAASPMMNRIQRAQASTSTANVPAGILQTQAPPAAADQDWYVQIRGLECGPMKLTELIDWAQTGRLMAQDSIKHGRNSPWIAANSVPGLMSPIKAAVPSAAIASPAPPQSQRPTTSSLRSISSSPTPVSLATHASAVMAPAAMPAPAPPQTNVTVPNIMTPEAPPTIGNTFAAAGMNGASSEPRPIYRPDLQPAKRYTAPGKKRKNQTSDGLDLGALLKDARVLGGLGSLAVVGLLVLGWNLLPESTGKFREPYQKVTAVYKDFEEKVKSKPAAGAWKELGDKTKDQLKPLEKELNELKTLHVVKERLKYAVSGLKSAANLSKAEDAEPKLKVIKKNLDDAAKLMGI